MKATRLLQPARLAASLAVLGLLLLAACAAHPEMCALCQRAIHPEVRTTVVFEDGRRAAACCPRCALHVAGEDGARVRSIEVTDYDGGGSLPMDRAWMVDGSDETPCLEHHAPVTPVEGPPLHACYDRCMPSLIAFSSEPAARAFAADHGGAIVPPAAR